MPVQPEKRRNRTPQGPAAITPPSADNDSTADRCLRCHRQLRASLSVARCRGPVCHRLDTTAAAVELVEWRQAAAALTEADRCAYEDRPTYADVHGLVIA